jgi:hypothetical protein
VVGEVLLYYYTQEGLGSEQIFCHSCPYYYNLPHLMPASIRRLFRGKEFLLEKVVLHPMIQGKGGIGVRS